MNEDTGRGGTKRGTTPLGFPLSGPLPLLNPNWVLLGEGLPGKGLGWPGKVLKNRPLPLRVNVAERVVSKPRPEKRPARIFLPRTYFFVPKLDIHYG